MNHKIGLGPYSFLLAAALVVACGGAPDGSVTDGGAIQLGDPGVASHGERPPVPPNSDDVPDGEVPPHIELLAPRGTPDPRPLDAFEARLPSTWNVASPDNRAH